MKYIIKNSDENVSRYVILNSPLLLFRNSTLSFNGKELSLSEKPVSGFETFGDNIFVNDWQGSYTIFDKELNIVEEGIGKAFFGSSENYICFQFLDEENILNDALLNPSGKEKVLGRLSKKNNINFTTQNFYFWIDSQNRIVCTDINNKSNKWEFRIDRILEYRDLQNNQELNEAVEVIAFLGVSENLLVVACNNSMIILVNVEKGEIIKIISNLPEGSDEELKKSFDGKLIDNTSAFQMNNNCSAIFGLYFYHFLFYDLKKHCFQIFNLKKELQHNGIYQFQIKNGYAENDEHYFTTFLTRPDPKTNVSKNGICAINKESLKIDWVEVLDHDISIQVPKLKKDLLYQLTVQGVLYTLEKI